VRTESSVSVGREKAATSKVEKEPIDKVVEIAVRVVGTILHRSDVLCHIARDKGEIYLWYYRRGGVLKGDGRNDHVQEPGYTDR